MSATGKDKLFNCNKKVIKAKAHWEGEPQTVIVAQRHYGYNKVSKIFIFGYGDSGYDCKKGDRKTYTIDTGNGYKNSGEILTIENVLTYATDGTMVSQNNTGLNEARPIWVMK